MTKMMELLVELFTEYIPKPFLPVSDENCLITSTFPDDHRAYFILYELSAAPEQSPTDFSAELYEKIKETGSKFYDEYFDKNTTLILLCPEGSRPSDKEIIRFEEDPYYFKKVVLDYTSDELSNLQQKLSEKAGDYASRLKALILEEGQFKQWQENPNQHAWFGLLARIFIKLSILNIEIPTATEEFLLKIKEGLSAEEQELQAKILALDEDSTTETILKHFEGVL